MLEYILNKPSPNGARLEWATVGWVGEDEYMFRGEGTDDGYTYIRVTLFRGMRTEATDPEVAPGHQLIAHISSGVTRIPPKGARVMVGIPEGMEHVMGGALILGVVEPTPLDQLQSDRTVMDFGADTHVVIRAKSVSIMDYNNRFITVGTPRAGGDASIMFQAEDGTGGAIKAGAIAWWVSSGGDAVNMLQMDASKTQGLVKNGGYYSVDANGFYAAGNNCSLQAGAVYCIGKVFLGTTPTTSPTTAAIALGTGVPPGAPSPSVFLSPV